MLALNIKQLLIASGFGVAIAIVVGLGVITSWSALNGAANITAALRLPTESPTSVPTSSPTPTFTLTPTATRQPTTTPTSTASPKPTLPLVLTRAPRPVAEHLLFGRPLALDAPGPVPNFHYLYGTTKHGKYEVHHGVDYDYNPIGTPVYAVGDGTVVTAGDDRQRLCGADGKSVCGRSVNFYGLVTVIRLAQAYRGKTLYALYGHMDRIDVRVGQRVKRGDAIGTVGMTGIALGPHIQFEIRVGANDYASTRNPMLWIAPLPGRGVLAGRYADAEGKPVKGAIVDIYRAEEPTTFFRETETYSGDEQTDVVSDDELGENFLMNDLPAGEYIVRVIGTAYSARVNIVAGKLAWVVIP